MPNRPCSARRLSLLPLLALLPGVFLAAGCASAPATHAAPLSPFATARQAPSPAGTLALTPYVAGLYTLAGEIAGRRLPFLFDTAGGVTLLTLESAQAAGCVPYGHDVGFRHDGGAIEMQRCAGVPLVLGSDRWPTRDAELTVFDLRRLLGDAPEVGGLVSLASFEGERITIDFAGARIVRESPASFAARIAGAEELRIRPGRQAAGAALDLFVAVDSPRGPLWFELDSGATGETLLAPHAAALLGLDLPTGESGTPRLAALPIHGTAPVVLPVRLREGLIYDGLISVAFFERFTVTLDLAEMRAWVRPLRPQPAVAAEKPAPR